jgi:signal transduction histidine kinase
MGIRITPPGLPDLDLKTKLLLMMLSLLALSGASLFILHLLSEQRLISQVRDYTEELSTAIDIAQQQPAEGDPKVVLKAYTEKLTELGVKDVTLALGPADEIRASTNPDVVGKRLIQKKKPGREWVIRGVLGDSPAGVGVPPRTSNLTIPVVVGDRRVGYLVITRYLDDFSALSREAFVSRLLATLGVFGVGIILSLYLSWTFSKPLRGLTAAARKVAAGDLTVRVDLGGGSEIASLSQTFNEMVERLSEKRQLEERLHFAERSTALGRLASAVAHEIRNPLNFINLSIDHVRERMAPADPGSKGDFDRILRNMKSEISRLNRLVGDFLSFGKPMRLDIRPCALDEVLREVASLVDHKARDQGITLEVQAAANLPRVTADPELLKTCFLNLMINAVDAMPEGGLLAVGIRERETEEGGREVEVHVSDTGSGMTPEAVTSAFEPYFSTKDAGLGLGLALTRKIVSDHGGSIVLESGASGGTTARIRLPLVATSDPDRGSEDLASALVAGVR